jgi:hypothetical protein
MALRCSRTLASIGSKSARWSRWIRGCGDGLSKSLGHDRDRSSTQMPPIGEQGQNLARLAVLQIGADRIAEQRARPITDGFAIEPGSWIVKCDV